MCGSEFCRTCPALLFYWLNAVSLCVAGGVGVNEKKLMAVFGTLPLEMALSSLQVSGKEENGSFSEEGGYVTFERPLFSRPQSLF